MERGGKGGQKSATGARDSRSSLESRRSACDAQIKLFVFLGMEEEKEKPKVE